MKLSAKQLNRFLIFKLPSAFFCGVRVKELNNDNCITSVKFGFINQNPFKSIYFAVLAMASELSTGALVLKATQESGERFSTLVVGMKAEFYKKAVGKVLFTCNDIDNFKASVLTAIETKEGVAFEMLSIGTDEQGDEVARFIYQWSIKIKASSN